VCPSLWGEGFSKTQVEVMACGCALVTTANGGSGDFAFHGETALVSDSRDVDTMARHIATLLRDDQLRISIAQRGHAYVQWFSWDDPNFFMGLPD
jgi:glycosyltransferase involved in cell wall biosynthesis